jgi:hypothetical protein
MPEPGTGRAAAQRLRNTVLDSHTNHALLIWYNKITKQNFFTNKNYINPVNSLFCRIITHLPLGVKANTACNCLLHLVLSANIYMVWCLDFTQKQIFRNSRFMNQLFIIPIVTFLEFCHSCRTSGQYIALHFRFL